LIHGDNDVSIVHLEPVYEEIRRRGIKAEFVSSFVEEKYAKIPGLICISTHNEILDKIKFGYKVHIDHSVKGKGVTYFEGLADIYRARDYYKGTDLQITEGVESFENTKKLMGPLKERVVMAGYPKSDTLIKFNTGENKNNIYEELGFDIDKILITYAPTGKYRYPFKQGASLSGRVLKCLKDIAKKNNYNLLIKLRSREPSYLKINKILKRIFIR
jgi:CDP-glycerol glycerophosphotransferase (TagB/SpsB family)